jgi:hypothetical protein
VFLLLLSQFGVHAKTHYCMDRFTHLEFFDGANHSDEASCVCGMEFSKTSGCCQDVEVHASVDVDGILFQNLSLQKQFAILLPTSNLFVFRFEPNLVEVAFTQTFLKPKFPPQWLDCWEVTKLLI